MTPEEQKTGLACLIFSVGIAITSLVALAYVVWAI